MLFCRTQQTTFVGTVEATERGSQGGNDVRYMLTFYANEQEWMALPPAERDAAIAEIGGWFAEQARAGKIEIAKRWPAGGPVEVRPLAD